MLRNWMELYYNFTSFFSAKKRCGMFPEILPWMIWLLAQYLKEERLIRSKAVSRQFFIMLQRLFTCLHFLLIDKSQVPVPVFLIKLTCHYLAHKKFRWIIIPAAFSYLQKMKDFHASHTEYKKRSCGYAINNNKK